MNSVEPGRPDRTCRTGWTQLPDRELLFIFPVSSSPTFHTRFVDSTNLNELSSSSTSQAKPINVSKLADKPSRTPNSSSSLLTVTLHYQVAKKSSSLTAKKLKSSLSSHAKYENHRRAARGHKPSSSSSSHRTATGLAKDQQGVIFISNFNCRFLIQQENLIHFTVARQVGCQALDIYDARHDT